MYYSVRIPGRIGIGIAESADTYQAQQPVFYVGLNGYRRGFV